MVVFYLYPLQYIFYVGHVLLPHFHNGEPIRKRKGKKKKDTPGTDGWLVVCCILYVQQQVEA